MRITQFRGRPVVDRATARTLGTIADVFVDAPGAQIIAVEVAHPGCAECVCIPAEWITHIGSGAVMVARRAGGDLAETARVTEHCLNCKSLVGLEVLDESGNRVGNLHDADVNLPQLAITRFELVPSGWCHWLKRRSQIQPDEVASCSRDIMLIRSSRVASEPDPVA